MLIKQIRIRGKINLIDRLKKEKERKWFYVK